MNKQITDQPIWTMESGEIIGIAQMTDSHLMDTIRMLERNAAVGYITVLVVEPEGDPTATEMEYGLDYLNGTEYADLLDEAKKRMLIGKDYQFIEEV